MATVKKMRMRKTFSGFDADGVLHTFPKGSVVEGKDLELVKGVQPKWLGPVNAPVSAGPPATTEADESAAVEK